MLITYSIFAAVLAAAMLFAGVRKLLLDKQALYDAGFKFTEDYTAGQVKLIALAEVLGGLGLVLPKLTGIVPALSPIAAVCLFVIMIGAVAVNIRPSEPAVPAIVATVFAAAAAALGFLIIFD
ncbi:DoxX family protein [Streptomyces sp. NPDC046942]|uniref:DoxX family protein n=1 Tax=Streptomyces sp. NPDC046942 TaxID=3155137 RepID=UPI0033C9D555